MPLATPIVLASASARRQELLKSAGVEFVIRPAHIPEIPRPRESQVSFAKRMALEKARAILSDVADRFVLAADTVVAIENQLLGKPQDADDAARMLRLLSGRRHQVTTGVCLIGDGVQDVRSETTGVQFLPLAEQEIQEYIKTGEPMDKAGAYAIQGGASRWIQAIEGDYTNVVGLPMGLVRRMLVEHGVI
jgi:septum formation protein